MLPRSKRLVQNCPRRSNLNSAVMLVALVLMHALTLLSQSHHFVRESDARGVRVSARGVKVF